MPRWLWLTLGGIGAAGAGATVAHFTHKPPEDGGPMLLRARGPQMLDPADDYEVIIAQGYDAAFASCEPRFGTLQDVLRCSAVALFPRQTWPPPPDAAPWQQAAWRIMDGRARQRAGLPPPSGRVV